MPLHDQRCTACDWTAEVVVRPHEHPACPSCGGATERYYPIGGRTNGVIPDEYVGGLTLENLGHQPVTVYSRSELKREMDARGLVHRVRHVGTPESDKSPHTSRWI